jgi:hypothetical protein
VRHAATNRNIIQVFAIDLAIELAVDLVLKFGLIA